MYKEVNNSQSNIPSYPFNFSLNSTFTIISFIKNHQKEFKLRIHYMKKKGGKLIQPRTKKEILSFSSCDLKINKETLLSLQLQQIVLFFLKKKSMNSNAGPVRTSAYKNKREKRAKQDSVEISFTFLLYPKEGTYTC